MTIKARCINGIVRDTSRLLIAILLASTLPSYDLRATIIDWGVPNRSLATPQCATVGQRPIGFDSAKMIVEEARQGDITLLRPQDQQLDWYQRIGKANQHGGEAFVLLQAELSPTESTSGIRLYLLQPNLKENLSLFAANQQQETTLLESFESVVFDQAAANSRLVSTLEIELRQTFPDLLIEVDRGLYFPLMGIKSPAVMIGMGFVTNKADCQRLTDRHWNKRFAKAIVQALHKFEMGLKKR